MQSRHNKVLARPLRRLKPRQLYAWASTDLRRSHLASTVTSVGWSCHDGATTHSSSSGWSTSCPSSGYVFGASRKCLNRMAGGSGGSNTAPSSTWSLTSYKSMVLGGAYALIWTRGWRPVAYYLPSSAPHPVAD